MNMQMIQKHDPITQFNFKWICESIMRASELFFYEDTLRLNGLIKPPSKNKQQEVEC